MVGLWRLTHDAMSFDSAKTLTDLVAGDRTYQYYSLDGAGNTALGDVSRLPYTLKIILENLIRRHAGQPSSRDRLEEMIVSVAANRVGCDVEFWPVRVMMDDTAGIPLIGDLAAMREEAARRCGDPQRINPVVPVDFIVDHSIMADHAASPAALARNAELEFNRNQERFRFLRWGAHALTNLRVVPPGNGICHQINLEYLARVVCLRDDGKRTIAYPDSMIGIDSHTPMINGLGVVGWGVSGLEGVAAALGEPVSLVLPEVVGCRLSGKLNRGVTATDLVLTLTQRLREQNVVGKFIEYFGPGLTALSLTDRATVANMTPEAGATMSYFPIDAETICFLHATGRGAAHAELVEAYARAQGLWHDGSSTAADYAQIVEIDLTSIEPSISGPGQPHERIALRDAPTAFKHASPARSVATPRGAQLPLTDGDIVIAAITSCTNTSNATGMISAGLLARNAVARGLTVKPWVKTSLSPGSRVVSDYLAKSGLQQSLDALGFQVTGFGCMTCVGFSGPLAPHITSAIRDHDISVAAVLSGNRNYRGRVHAQVEASFLASPSLVVAYAIAGSILKDVSSEPLGVDAQGKNVYVRDIWPEETEVRTAIERFISPDLYRKSYANLYTGSSEWQALDYQRHALFAWDPSSTVLRRPPLIEASTFTAIRGARILAMFGDFVTTEHVSPMGHIPDDAPASRYLASVGVDRAHFVSYAARRLNHGVMLRGTFSSAHLHNRMTPGMPGGSTHHLPDDEVMPTFEAAQRYRDEGVPLVIIAGRSYGTGSSRDWAAKGPRLLGVRAIIAESFERIHRTNLVAAGILPLEFTDGHSSHTLQLTGHETIDIEEGIDAISEPMTTLTCNVTRADGTHIAVNLLARLETQREIQYFAHGGIINYLLHQRCS